MTSADVRTYHPPLGSDGERIAAASSGELIGRGVVGTHMSELYMTMTARLNQTFIVEYVVIYWVYYSRRGDAEAMANGTRLEHACWRQADHVEVHC